MRCDGRGVYLCLNFDLIAARRETSTTSQQPFYSRRKSTTASSCEGHHLCSTCTTSHGWASRCLHYPITDCSSTSRRARSRNILKEDWTFLCLPMILSCCTSRRILWSGPVWKSNFGRPTPSTRGCPNNCGRSMAWRFTKQPNSLVDFHTGRGVFRGRASLEAVVDGHLRDR